MDMDPGMPMDDDFPMFDLGNDALGPVGGGAAGNTRGKKRVSYCHCRLMEPY